MLIGLERKFIFIANMKSASTAIEDALRPISEIALSNVGKHWPFYIIEERFNWIFDVISRDDFLVFGVIRDPEDYIISLYNSHAHIGFRSLPDLYTGSMNFDKFIAEWIPKNTNQIEPQFHRFLNKKGSIGADYIISFANLQQGINFVVNVISYPRLSRLDYTNVSAHHLRREDLSTRHRAWIAERFRPDYDFMARFCDRVIPADTRPFDQDIELPASAPEMDDLSGVASGHAAATSRSTPRMAADTKPATASLGRQLIAAWGSAIRSAGDHKRRSPGGRKGLDRLLGMSLAPMRSRRQDLEPQPITLGRVATTHMRLIAWCKACGHQVELDIADETARYGAITTVDHRVKQLQCPACGGRDSDFMISGAAR